MIGFLDGTWRCLCSWFGLRFSLLVGKRHFWWRALHCNLGVAPITRESTSEADTLLLASLESESGTSASSHAENLEGFGGGTSLVAQTVKRLATMRETWVQSLGREDFLEKEMATHSSILVWKNSMDGGTWWATVHGVTKSRTRLSDFTFTFGDGAESGR